MVREAGASGCLLPVCRLDKWCEWPACCWRCSSVRPSKSLNRALTHVDAGTRHTPQPEDAILIWFDQELSLTSIIPFKVILKELLQTLCQFLNTCKITNFCSFANDLVSKFSPFGKILTLSINLVEQYLVDLNLLCKILTQSANVA